MRPKTLVCQFVFICCSLSLTLSADPITATWAGGTSTDWNTAGNWSPNGVPNNGTNSFNALITNAGDALLNFPAIAASASDTVSNLTLGTNTSLQINGTLTLAGAAGNSNLLSNAGNISVGSTGNLSLTGANQTITFDGSGTLSLATAFNSGIIGNSTGMTLVNNAAHTIQGYGNIQQANGDSMIITNHGTISANVSGQTLEIGPLRLPGTTNNDGLLTAMNGGQLDFFGQLNNAGGTVTANGGSVYIGLSSLNSGSATGGTFSVINSGSLFFNGSQSSITVNSTSGSTTVQTGGVTNGNFTLNGSSTLTLGNSSNVEFISGAIRNNSGSTVNVSNGASLSGTLNNAAGGQVNVSAQLNISGGLTLNNNGDFRIQAGGELLTSDPSFTFGGAGTVTLASTSALITDNETVALTNNETIQGQGKISLGIASTLLNQGTITANAAGGTLTVQQTNITNTGTLSAGNGGTLFMQSGFITNTGGTISANGGTITMLDDIGGGAINATNSGTITVASNVDSASVSLTGGGTLSNQGEFTNASATVSGTNSKLDITGSWAGSVDVRSGGLLQTDGSSAFYVGNITVESGGSMTVNELSLTGSTAVTNNGAITVNGIFQNQTGAALTFGGTGTLTLSGGTLSNGGSNSTGTVTNQTGHTITGNGTIQNGGFINYGNLNVAAGGVISDQTAGTASPNTTFNNYGAVTVAGQLLAGSNVALNFNNGGTVTLNGGTIGSVSGATGTSAINNAGSTIQGNGTISTASFTNNGNLIVTAGSQIWIDTNLTNLVTQSLLSGNYDVRGTLKINGAAIDSNYAQLTLDGASAHVTDQNGNDALKSLTLNAAAGIYTFENGASESVSNMMNYGSMFIGTGSSFSSGNIFAQQEGQTEVNGTLTATLVAVNGGELSGTGSVDGAVQVASGATLAPGDDPGKLTINGNLSEQAGGDVQIEIASGSSFDQLIVNGNAQLNGTLTLILLDGFIPADGESFQFLTWDSNTGATFFSNLILPSLNGEDFTVAADADGLLATFHTPEPGTWFMGLAGLAMVLFGTRRRNASKPSREAR